MGTLQGLAWLLLTGPPNVRAELRSPEVSPPWRILADRSVLTRRHDRSVLCQWLTKRYAASEAYMPMTQTEIDGFNASLKDALPRLRVYALSLTRDPDRADNLVQQTSLNALAGRESFRPGTNFGGWIFRIERNEFLSGLRRERPTVDIDYAHATLSTPPTQDSGLVLREFMTAFRQVSRGSRQALLLSTLGGQSYEQIAIHTGVAEGTVKSRISRGRAALQRLLAGAGPPLSLPKTLSTR
jgi:RNA polymerase sigma-70 factor (ECF subfamily)